MTDEGLAALAKAAEAARLAKGWSKERAAREADVSSITYKRVEDGLKVQDAKLAAIKAALGLDDPTPAVPVGAGVDPEVLAELQELSPTDVQRVRDFMRGIRSGG